VIQVMHACPSCRCGGASRVALARRCSVTSLKPATFLLRLRSSDTPSLPMLFRKQRGTLHSVFINTLEAAQVMHAEGLVHRDVKPANIMRCIEGGAGKADDSAYTYKLIDFGTALGVDERVARAAMLTIGNNRGVGAGTPPYMSPEMFKVPFVFLCSGGLVVSALPPAICANWGHEQIQDLQIALDVDDFYGVKGPYADFDIHDFESKLLQTGIALRCQGCTLFHDLLSVQFTNVFVSSKSVAQSWGCLWQ
jgi:serine/threonine protein kinase